MMSLTVERKQTNQTVANLWRNTFFRRYWRAIGRFLGRGKEVSIWVSAAVVMFLNLVIGTGISALLGETHFTRVPLILTNLMWVTYTYFTIILFLQIHSRLLEFLSLRLVESIKSANHLQELQVWARQWLGRMFGQVLFSVVFAFIVASLGFYAIYQANPFSVGTLFIYFIDFFHLSAAVYGLFSLIAFLLRLRNWNLRLYPDDPASSPILLQLSERLRNYLLGYSFLIAVFQLMSTLVAGFSTLIILEFLIFNWIPILTLFILGHLAFSNQIKRVKYARMEAIQSEIMKRSRLEQLEPNTVSQVMSLMDYHDRIKATRNSLITSPAIINLLVSLALPSLTSLIQAWLQNVLK